MLRLDNGALSIDVKVMEIGAALSFSVGLINRDFKINNRKTQYLATMYYTLTSRSLKDRREADVEMLGNRR